MRVSLVKDLASHQLIILSSQVTASRGGKVGVSGSEEPDARATPLSFLPSRHQAHSEYRAPSRVPQAQAHHADNEPRPDAALRVARTCVLLAGRIGPRTGSPHASKNIARSGRLLQQEMLLVSATSRESLQAILSACGSLLSFAGIGTRTSDEAPGAVVLDKLDTSRAGAYSRSLPYFNRDISAVTPLSS